MKIPVKELLQSKQTFAPITIAEAVLVNHSTGVIRLDKALDLKLETVITPQGSGLTSLKINLSVIISHNNKIEPNLEIKPLQISLDTNGHVTGYQEIKPLILKINDNVIKYDGSNNSGIEFGDDFDLNNLGQVLIIWNNLN